MRAYPNIARVLLLGIFATGCAHVTPLGALPQKEEDFHLPARELVARFPAVEGLHGDHRKIYDKSLSLGDLQTLWGDAARRRYYWEAEVTKYTTLSGLGITVSHLLPPVALGTLVLTPMLLTPKPVQQYVWDKGEYRITGTFGKTLLHNEPQLLGWEWARRDTQGSKVTYRPWLVSVNNWGAFVSLDHSVGGDEIGHSADSGYRLAAGDNTEFAAGLRIPLLDDKGLSFRISGGYRYSGFIGMTQGTHLTQIPVRMVFEYQLHNSVLRTGVGAVYALNPEISSENAAGVTTTNEFPATAGLVLQLEFRPLAAAGIGVRYEYLPMQHIYFGKLDASSIGMYWAWYL